LGTLAAALYSPFWTKLSKACAGVAKLDTCDKSMVEVSTVLVGGGGRATAPAAICCCCCCCNNKGFNNIKSLADKVVAVTGSMPFNKTCSGNVGSTEEGIRALGRLLGDDDFPVLPVALPVLAVPTELASNDEGKEGLPPAAGWGG